MKWPSSDESHRWNPCFLSPLLIFFSTPLAVHRSPALLRTRRSISKLLGIRLVFYIDSWAGQHGRVIQSSQPSNNHIKEEKGKKHTSGCSSPARPTFPHKLMDSAVGYITRLDIIGCTTRPWHLLASVTGEDSWESLSLSV
jgi:hypothetical protein